METNIHGSPGMAICSTVMSLSSGFIAFISIGDVQALGGLVATAIAILSGLFACRYYYWAIKEKKQNIKK